MNYLTVDLFAVWAAGGRSAYCHLQAAREWAMAARDWVAAAEIDFLTDILDSRTALEMMSEAA